jgi:hypothetical protein
MSHPLAAAARPLNVVAPRADDDLLRSLRDVLIEAGYGGAVVDEARRLRRFLPAGDAMPPALRAQYDTDRLPPLAALLTLEEDVSAGVARRALSPLQLERLVEAGLLELDRDQVRSPFRIGTAEGLFLFGDGRGAIGRDHVMGMSGPSKLTAWLTPREPRGSMLDLGTGSSVQAILAAGHCERVVGVDINPRALGFADLNARLNGVENVEWRRGSWLEPVEGEYFDLIVANPPYVVSPDSEFTYRDSGMSPGELVARLCREIPAHLEEGGVAVVLCQWPHSSGDDWDVSPRAWTRGTGCDAIAVRFSITDPLEHAVGWNAPPVRSLTPEVFQRTVARWYRYCEETGTGAISFGAIVLRRTAGGIPWRTCVRGSSPPGEHAARQLTRMLAGNDLNQDGGELLDRSYAVPEGLTVSQRFVGRESGWVARTATAGVPGELGVSASLDPDALDVLFRCDGRSSLRQLVETEADAALAVSAVRDLLRHGLLELV